MSHECHDRAGVIVLALSEAAARGHVFNPPAGDHSRGDVLVACADAGRLEMARRSAREG